MHSLVYAAFKELYLEKEPARDMTLKYSKAFKSYNANVRYTKDVMHFKLSHVWKEVSDEIKIGLIQSLLNKVNNTDEKTMNLELYDIFMEKAKRLAPVTDVDPDLHKIFETMNDLYFAGMLSVPNLKWGGSNFSTLGTYNYLSDTIMISDVFRNHKTFLDYIMYHEMLHKKLGYKESKTRRRHHTKEFRDREREFYDHDIEKKLKSFLRKKRIFKNLV